MPHVLRRPRLLLALSVLALFALSACRALLSLSHPGAPFARSCVRVAEGFGPAGRVPIRVETVVTGLETPWGIAFLPDGAMLVTERPGRVRLVRDGVLVPEPVVRVPVSARAEEGLLGIALHPAFAVNRSFYLYYTRDAGGRAVNRLERYTLSPDATRAAPDRVLLDDIPGASLHNGGRLRFGPDGMLYASTGDARDANTAQRDDTLAGKILRMTPEGAVPRDNPWPDRLAFATGVRSSPGFDWRADGTLLVADHGPTGEFFRMGHDEVNVVTPGANLGWPRAWGCETRAGVTPPALTWDESAPPGGAAVYTGDAIPEWRGSFLVATLRSMHLHRVIFDDARPPRVRTHEVYLQGTFGRLRDVIMGPDRQLYMTTSNCDGHAGAVCPPGGDRVLRVTR